MLAPILLAQASAFSTHALPSNPAGKPSRGRGFALSRPSPMLCTSSSHEVGNPPLTLRGGGGDRPSTLRNVSSLPSRASCHRLRLLQAAVALSVAVLLPSAVLAAGKAAQAVVTTGSLIQPTDSWGLWTTLLVCAAAGLRAEKTRVGAALSSPLVTMFISLVLVNVGVLPTDAPIYGAINKFLVPLAVPMLLLGADLRRVFRDTGSLLLAFMIGTVATVCSTIVAAAVLPMHSVDGAWKIAAGQFLWGLVWVGERDALKCSHPNSFCLFEYVCTIDQIGPRVQYLLWLPDPLRHLVCERRYHFRA